MPEVGRHDATRLAAQRLARRAQDLVNDRWRSLGALRCGFALEIRSLLLALSTLPTRSRRAAAGALALEQRVRHWCDRRTRGFHPTLRLGSHRLNPPYTAPATCPPTASAPPPPFPSKLPPSSRGIPPPPASPGGRPCSVNRRASSLPTAAPIR